MTIVVYSSDIQIVHCQFCGIWLHFALEHHATEWAEQHAQAKLGHEVAIWPARIMFGKKIP